jgi:hypothetical protein
VISMYIYMAKWQMSWGLLKVLLIYDLPRKSTCKIQLSLSISLVSIPFLHESLWCSKEQNFNNAMG